MSQRSKAATDTLSEASHAGPGPMAPRDLETFFGFYKKNPSRRLRGFFNDIRRSTTNVSILSRYLGRLATVRCLIAGCAHWANPKDLALFIHRFNVSMRPTIVALDVLPQALSEAVRHKVDFVPVVTPAQDTPFLDRYFDILVADGLLNCCSFDQHAPIVEELYRIARPGAVILLGLAHAAQNAVVHSRERAMPAYCRPLSDFKRLFTEAGFSFPRGSSITTRFGGRSDIRIENCIAQKPRGKAGQP
jgi:SAM-dependent methyltransferase